MDGRNLAGAVDGRGKEAQEIHEVWVEGGQTGTASQIELERHVTVVSEPEFPDQWLRNRLSEVD
jgi:hypothetical protein